MSHHYCYKTVTILLLSIMLIAGCKKQEIFTPNPTNGRTTAIFDIATIYGTVTDVDGNIYKTVKIGDYTWMAENLRTTHYQNGVAIPNITDNTKWGQLLTGAYRNYKDSQNNDSLATFGRLYNWYTVADTQKLAPKGWHVATDAEWINLKATSPDNLGSIKFKETGSTHWKSPNTGATNVSGFTALPGGLCGSNGVMSDIASKGFWWSATIYNSTNSYSWSMDYDKTTISTTAILDNIGNSVRCVKD